MAQELLFRGPEFSSHHPHTVTHNHLNSSSRGSDALLGAFGHVHTNEKLVNLREGEGNFQKENSRYFGRRENGCWEMNREMSTIFHM